MATRASAKLKASAAGDIFTAVILVSSVKIGGIAETTGVCRRTKTSLKGWSGLIEIQQLIHCPLDMRILPVSLKLISYIHEFKVRLCSGEPGRRQPCES